MVPGRLRVPFPLQVKLRVKGISPCSVMSEPEYSASDIAPSVTNWRVAVKSQTSAFSGAAIRIPARWYMQDVRSRNKGRRKRFIVSKKSSPAGAGLP